MQQIYTIGLAVILLVIALVVAYVYKPEWFGAAELANEDEDEEENEDENEDGDRNKASIDVCSNAPDGISCTTQNGYVILNDARIPHAPGPQNEKGIGRAPENVGDCITNCNMNNSCTGFKYWPEGKSCYLRSGSNTLAQDVSGAVAEVGSIGGVRIPKGSYTRR